MTKKTNRGMPRRGTIVKFAIAACAALGIGAAATVAAWTQSVAFTASTNVQSFGMQYSFDNSTWHDFESGADVPLSGFPQWMDPSTPSAQHTIFVQNIGTSPTHITFTPHRTGVFADNAVLSMSTGLNAGSQTSLVGESATVVVSGAQVARIDLVLTPSALPQSQTEQAGSLRLQVTGTVGDASASPAAISPARVHLEEG